MAQNFTSLGIDAERPGCAVETGSLEMLQQREDRIGRPAALPAQGVAQADDGAMRAALKQLFIAHYGDDSLKRNGMNVGRPLREGTATSSLFAPTCGHYSSGAAIRTNALPWIS